MGANHQPQSSMVMAAAPLSPDPIVQLEARFKSWLAKQPIPVEAAVVTATSAFPGAAIGGLIGTLYAAGIPASLAAITPQAMASLMQALAFVGGPLIQARNFAVMTGVNAGISCVMKRVRGVEDIKSSMVAAFGSRALFSLVSSMGGPHPVTKAVTSGVLFALFQGGLFKLGKKFSQPPAGDLYTKTRSLLTNLGLQNYEKNFKRGLLSDSTLPLLTDRALREVKIPPGARLLILDHISRDTELKRKR